MTRARRLEAEPLFDVAVRTDVRIGSCNVPFEWAALGLYVSIGLFACWFVFASQLPGPDAFFGRWDNQLHLNAVRSFLDTGNWSSLHVSTYASSPDYAIPFASRTERYPAAWHDVVALVCVATGQAIPVCVNALNIVLAGVVYPSAAFLFVKALFANDKLIVLAGAGAASAFTAFPWGLFVKGPLYPNFAGFTVMTLFLAALVICFERKLVHKSPMPFASFALISFFALVLVHPNALFAAFVFLAAYVSHAAYASVRASCRFGERKASFLAACCCISLLVLACLLLAALTYAPPLQNVVRYDINPRMSISEALWATALLNLGRISLTYTAPEYLLAMISACGAVCCIAKRRFWLLIPCAYMAAAFVLACSKDISATRLVAGLWYNDPIRLASCYEVFLLPVAAYGLANITRIPGWLKGKTASDRILKLHGKGPLPNVCPTLSREGAKRDGVSFPAKPPIGQALVIAIVTVLLFVPALPLPGGSKLTFGIGAQQELIGIYYGSGKYAVYSAQEREFVLAARDTVPEGAVVLNQPQDGSMFSYALDDLNTYYRRITGNDETDASMLIRTGLAKFAADPAVHDAVKSTGAKYLIMLDQGIDKKRGRWMPQYRQKDWSGINAVRDDTPGFSVVLAKDDMRLYRIEY